MVDQAVQNLMGNIDSFGITGAAAKPPDKSRNNPFADSNNIQSNTTLGELKAKTTTTSGSEKKPVMNAPRGALVMSGNQSGNWGGYAQPMQQQPPMTYVGQMGAGAPPMQQQAPQYGMAGGYQQQQQPPMAYGGHFGAAPPMQQPPYGAYGAPPQQGQGMPPPMQQYQQPQQPQWGGAPTH